MVLYIVVFILLLILELFYFKVADYYNIIDKPNDRSSHSVVTLRGGGIVFYFGAMIYFVSSGCHYPWFFLGLTLMTTISFLDDIFTLSNKIRLIVHFASVLLMAYQLDLFDMPWYYLFSGFIVVVGVINAYNFMDGINGITGCYSLAVGGLLLMVNRYSGFVEQDLLVFSLLGVVIFMYFNFRIRAKCFAGDVGSVAIAYILLFALGLLILKSGNLIYILFLSIYGIDAVWTILQRLSRRENIFEAHRSHLYQFLGNEAGVNKLLISFFYGFVQFLIGLLVIYVSRESFQIQLVFSITILSGLSIIYLIVKRTVIKKYVKN